ncbi:MAG TPA: tetratricopeptide repeat protein [Acidisarcina sp.]|nr:tetratricopeptide repeat protein [Acidisarcina sp.]
MDRSIEEIVFRARAVAIREGSLRLRGMVAVLAMLLPAILTTPVAAQRNSPAYQSSLLNIQKHIESGDLDGARILLSQASRQYPADGGIENLLGVVEIQQGHSDAAERAFAQAIRHSPRLTSAYLNLGRAYMLKATNNKEEQAKALRIYERALSIAPTNAEANYQAAVLLMLAENYPASLDHVEKLSQQAQSVPGALALLCGDHAALGHREESERAASALASHPDFTEADVLQILPVLQAAHRSELAVQLFTAAASRAPLSLQGQRSLGLAQESAGNLGEARDTLERVFAADPASAAVLVDLARIAHSQKDDKGALGYLAHARDIAPGDPRLPYYFGLTCLDLGLLAESRKAFGEAVQLAPENPDYNYAMGTVSAFAQDATLALPYLKKYHALRPQNPSGILALGTTYFRAKDFDTAIPWLKQATAFPKTAATAHYYLGRIARQQGRLEDALTELSQSVDLKPDQPEMLAELGQLYVQTHKYPEAEKQLTRALAISPDNYTANFSLLQLYARTGDSRREQQAKRFDEIKSKNETQYQEMMRILEVRPQEGSAR